MERMAPTRKSKITHQCCLVCAGLYLGEIARRIILRLADEASLFGQQVPEQLKVKGALHTSQMSQIDHDTSPDLQTTACMLQQCLQLPADELTLEACQAVSLSPICLA